MARLSLLTAVACFAITTGVTALDPLDYVDPLIGSANGGEQSRDISDAVQADNLQEMSFLEQLVPMVSSSRFLLRYHANNIEGMAKAVADTDSGSNQGGFAWDGSNITGFSSMHDSGTGGSPSLGNFALFPYSGCTDDDINQCAYPKKERRTQFQNDSVIASPGYFGVTMNSGIVAEMTVEQHTSLFRFTIPAASGNSSNVLSPLLLMDLTDLSDSRQDNASIVVDDSTGRMTGSGRFLPSFGSGSYVLYFCADFRGPALQDTGIFVNSRAGFEPKNLTISRSINGYPLPGGAFVRFEPPTNGTSTVLARVGVSFISSEQACSNAEIEIPDFDFEGTLDEAIGLWKERMDRVIVSTEGVDEPLLTNFYSGVYRTMINPQDYTGENPLWQSTKPYFDSFYW